MQLEDDPSVPGPLVENINPIIEEGISNANLWVLPFQSNNDLNGARQQQVEVVKRENPRQAYHIDYPTTIKKELRHGGPLWGYACRGFILQRAPVALLGGNTSPDALHIPYMEPTPEEWLRTYQDELLRQGGMGMPQQQASIVPIRHVMIKKLYWDVVERDLHLGSAENPLVEIFRMQEQENIFQERQVLRPSTPTNFLPCIEALWATETTQDGRQRRLLYIITPFCEGGSLGDRINGGVQPSLEIEGQARSYFRQMLRCLNDLHSQGIAHRDIDPTNFLVGGQEGSHHVVLADLAMSFRYPQAGRVRMKSRAGKLQFFPPEVYTSRVFEPVQADLWACVVSLFCLLTGQLIYNRPVVADVGYRYAILARGLSNDMTNEMAMEVIEDMDFAGEELDLTGESAQRHTLQDTMLLNMIVPKIMMLSPQVRELFQNSLQNDAQSRWNLEQILRSDWMNMPLPGER